MTESRQVEIVTNYDLAVQQQSAELDIQITTAKAYPRKPIECFHDMQQIVEDLGPEYCEKLYYIHPVYKDDLGRPVEGGSVRLAEIVANQWGNLRVQSVHVSTNQRDVVAEAVAWDLEKNVAIRVQKVGSIMGKGGRYSDNMIAKTIMAQQARAFRDVVFKVVPRPFVDGLWKRAKELASQSKDLESRRKKLVDWFIKLGATRDQVFARIGVGSVEEITPDMIVELRGIANAIKEGSATIQDFIQTEDAKAKTMDDLADKLNGDEDA